MCCYSSEKLVYDKPCCEEVYLTEASDMLATSGEIGEGFIVDPEQGWD